VTGGEDLDGSTASGREIIHEAADGG
jgi:hypothetical protein